MSDDPAESDDEPTPAAPTEQPTGQPTAEPVPLTRAQKLEAKAARLRAAEARRAAAGAAPGRGGALVWMIISGVAVLAVLGMFGYALHENSRAGDAEHAASKARQAAAAAQAQARTAAADVLSQDQSFRDSALKFATTVSASFGTYSYKTLNADFARTRSYLTSSFAADFAQLTSSLGSLISQDRGVTVGTVEGAGIESITPTSAVVLVFLDQKVTTAQSSTPRLDHNRLKLTLAWQPDKQWLVSKLELV